MQDRDTLTTRSVNLGLISNVLLSVMKTVIGILGHSSALLADGINSTSDVVYYIAVKIFMHQAKKPADKEHPYGHRQLESVAAIDASTASVLGQKNEVTAKTSAPMKPTINPTAGK